MGNNSVKVLIPEWIPSLNKGELAILIGMMKTFDILGKAEVSIFSFYPSVDNERYPENINIIDVGNDLYLGDSLPERLDSFKFGVFLFTAFQHFFFILLCKLFGKNASKIMNRAMWKEYCESDVIIFCHDQVNCIGVTALYTTLLAKALQKPIVIYANGTYYNGRKISKILAPHVLNNVDLITLRDIESFLSLKQFVWDEAKIHLAGDPAILLDPVDYKKVNKIFHEKKIDKNDGVLVGVAITHGLVLHAFKEQATNAIRYKKIITEIAKSFDLLIENFNATIIFIPHCIEPYLSRDDRVIAKEIYSVMKNKHKVRLITKEYSPEELKGLVAGFDLLISARIHAVIDALSMGVPSLTLASGSDRRPYTLIGKMLEQGEWVYNIENLDASKFYARISDLLSASDAIRKNLSTIISSAKDRALLNGKLLKALLDSQLRKEDLRKSRKNEILRKSKIIQKN